MRLRVFSAGKYEQDEERIKGPQDAEEAGEVRTIFLKPSFPGGSYAADSLREDFGMAAARHRQSGIGVVMPILHGVLNAGDAHRCVSTVMWTIPRFLGRRS
jgi:hypothetical protein